jgi:hypothetical protein
MTDDGDCGAIGGMKIGRGNRSTRRKPAPAPLCPPQIPLDLDRGYSIVVKLHTFLKCIEIIDLFQYIKKRQRLQTRCRLITYVGMNLNKLDVGAEINTEASICLSFKS